LTCLPCAPVVPKRYLWFPTPPFRKRCLPLSSPPTIGVALSESCHRDVPKSPIAWVPAAGRHCCEINLTLGPEPAVDPWSLPSRQGHIMRLPRRRFLRLAVGAVTLPTISRAARAQTYPVRPVRIVVAAPAAGATDITARLIGQRLSERLGRSFLIENRAGGNSNIGTEAVVRAPADGYTLLLAFSVNAINASLYERLSYNFIRDIAPIARIADTPFIKVVNHLFPAKQFKPIRASLMRARPAPGHRSTSPASCSR
jgi:Tripartite tricarboxylate transporter family receptor